MQVEIINDEIITIEDSYDLKYPYKPRDFLGMDRSDLNSSLSMMTNGKSKYYERNNFHPLLAAIVLAIKNNWTFGVFTTANGVVCPDCDTFVFRDDFLFRSDTKIKQVIGNAVTLISREETYIIDLNSIIEIKIADEPIDAMKLVDIHINVKTHVEDPVTKEVSKFAEVKLTSRSYDAAADILSNLRLPESAREIEPDDKYIKLMENVYYVDNTFKLASLLRDTEGSVPCIREFGDDSAEVLENLSQRKPYLVSLSIVHNYGGDKPPIQYEVNITEASQFQDKLSEQLLKI